MPDESGRVRPISVPRVPWHEKPEPEGYWPTSILAEELADQKIRNAVLAKRAEERDHGPEIIKPRRLRPHPFGFGAWEVIEDEETT